MPRPVRWVARPVGAFALTAARRLWSSPTRSPNLSRSELRAWMIRVGSTRKWMCGHQTPTRGTKWIPRCQSLKSILRLEIQHTRPQRQRYEAGKIPGVPCQGQGRADARAGHEIMLPQRAQNLWVRLFCVCGTISPCTEGNCTLRVRNHLPSGAVLDLVGNTTFMDSLSMLRRGGRMCLAGWLGGLDPVNSFNPLLQMPSGVYFTFFGSFVFGTPDFPVSDIPLQSIVDKVAKGIYKAKPARVFQFDDIRQAHEAMESNQANGTLKLPWSCGHGNSK